jgi:hypothetical protein
VSGGEETRYRELMQQHHYLGDLAKIGHTLRTGAALASHS